MLQSGMRVAEDDATQYYRAQALVRAVWSEDLARETMIEGPARSEAYARLRTTSTTHADRLCALTKVLGLWRDRDPARWREVFIAMADLSHVPDALWAARLDDEGAAGVLAPEDDLAVLGVLRARGCAYEATLYACATHDASLVTAAARDMAALDSVRKWQLEYVDGSSRLCFNLVEGYERQLMNMHAIYRPGLRRGAWRLARSFGTHFGHVPWPWRWSRTLRCSRLCAATPWQELHIDKCGLWTRGSRSWRKGWCRRERRLRRQTLPANTTGTVNCVFWS